MSRVLSAFRPHYHSESPLARQRDRFLAGGLVDSSHAVLGVLGRPPREWEAARCGEVVDKHGFLTVARAPLNSNEFLFIE